MNRDGKRRRGGEPEVKGVTRWKGGEGGVEGGWGGGWRWKPRRVEGACRWRV